jgi:hypothetical protein
MDDQNFKDLAAHAWDVYEALQCMQKMMNRMFFEEFLEIDQRKLKQAIERKWTIKDDLPF